MQKKTISLLGACGMVIMSLPGFLYALDFDVRLTRYQGNVGIRLHGDAVFSDPETGMDLEQGDMVKTSEDASAEISINGKGILLVEENSTFVIGGLNTTKSWFSLGSGALIITIKKLLQPKEEMHIRTKTSVVGIRGTEVAVETEGDETTQVGLFEGQIEVFSVHDGFYQLSDPIVLTAGEQTRVDYLKDPLKPFPLQKRMIEHKKKAIKLRSRLADIKKKWHRVNKMRSKKLRRNLKKKNHRKK
ncbi:MAG: FecR family protein [bacterium]